MANYKLNVTGEELNIGAQQLANRTFTGVMSTTAPSDPPTLNTNVPTTGWIDNKYGDKSEVEYTQIVQQGTKIATITIDGTTTNIYAPSGGGGSSIITWNQIQTASGGTKIATITIDDIPTDVYAPTPANAVTGVKGNEEVSYRTGDVNITAANIGAYVKPPSGIPSTDMTSAVQTSLGKADSALQSHQDISGLLPKTGGTMNGGLVANSTAVATLTTAQMRNIKASSEDIEVGDTLATGDIYLVYE